MTDVCSGTLTEEICENGLVFDGYADVHNHCNYNWAVDCGKRVYDDTPISSPGCLYQFGIYPVGEGCQTTFFKVNYRLIFIVYWYLITISTSVCQRSSLWDPMLSRVGLLCWEACLRLSWQCSILWQADRVSGGVQVSRSSWATSQCCGQKISSIPKIPKAWRWDSLHSGEWDVFDMAMKTVLYGVMGIKTTWYYMLTIGQNGQKKTTSFMDSPFKKYLF